jgi:hypothetical protein
MRLTEKAWDFYAGGAEDKRTVADNCEAFRQIKLRPRVLVNVTNRHLGTEPSGETRIRAVVIASRVLFLDYGRAKTRLTEEPYTERQPIEPVTQLEIAQPGQPKRSRRKQAA